MGHNILLAGSGNIGFRYLQGICKIKYLKLNVFVFDKKKSKEKEIIDKISSYKNKNIKISQLSPNDQKFDLAIISTTANERAKLIKSLKKKYKIKIWLIEKIIEQSVANLNLINKYLKNENVFVNIPRREMQRYIKLKKKIKYNKNIYFRITGGNWGLASNSIHFLDLVLWITNSFPIEVKNSLNGIRWKRSVRRKGFLEANGSFRTIFSNNNELLIQSSNDTSKLKIEIFENENKWIFNEVQLKIQKKKRYFVHCNPEVKKNNKVVYRDKIILQSQISQKIIKNLLLKKSCKLPNLQSQIQLHKILINYFISTTKKKLRKIQIT